MTQHPVAMVGGATNGKFPPESARGPTLALPLGGASRHPTAPPAAGPGAGKEGLLVAALCVSMGSATGWDGWDASHPICLLFNTTPMGVAWKESTSEGLRPLNIRRVEELLCVRPQLALSNTDI